MKVRERVMEMWVRRGVSSFENKFKFMPRRSTIEAIHFLKRVVE